MGVYEGLCYVEGRVVGERNENGVLWDRRSTRVAREKAKGER